MPKRSKSTRNIVILLVIVLIAGLGIIASHDGLIGATSIVDINNGNVPNGTQVIVKGEVTARLGDIHTITVIGGSNTLVFTWSGSSPPLHSVIVVRGVVSSVITLSAVSSVDVVWLFR
jgi:hypothetical protein